MQLAEHNRSNMKKNNLIWFAQSLIFLPVMSLSFGGIHNIEVPQSVLAQKFNIEVNGVLAFNQATNLETEALKIKAQKSFIKFKQYNFKNEFRIKIP